MRGIELSQALVVAMSCRLEGTVGRIARKMRYIEAKAPLFLRSGIIRDVPSQRFERVHAVGIASKSRSLPAFGGVLYGAAALRHDVVVVGGKVTETYQDSRVDINDMDYVDVRERLTWKEYVLVYRLLTDLMESSPRPDVVFVDTPLLVPRADQTVSAGHPEIETEWANLQEVMLGFWQRYFHAVFPNDPNGPFLVSLQSKSDIGSAVLNAIRGRGQDGTPETIGQEAVKLVEDEWLELRKVGVLRFLRGALRAGHRTVAYYYDALGHDLTRFEPQSVANHGLVGMHMQVGYRTKVWLLETIGTRGQWDSVSFDRLASMTAYLTVHDNPAAVPLPLWYATSLVKMPRVVLDNYLRSALSMLRDHAVDLRWLDGCDSIAEELGEE